MFEQTVSEESPETGVIFGFLDTAVDAPNLVQKQEDRKFSFEKS